MRVEQLEKCVYDSVMQMKDYHELQKFLSYFGNVYRKYFCCI